VAVTSLRAEVTDLLSRLIRVDTTNPPGNETAAAELLREYLEANGVRCETYARVPERANLVARMQASGRCRRSPARCATTRCGAAVHWT
jgi:acetylornithine deacetylase/succinyl-diaminopimelate desuccinylase-like protein